MKTKLSSLLLLLMTLCYVVLSGQTIQKETDGVIIALSHDLNGIKTLRLNIWTDNVVQVIATPTDGFSKRSSLIIPETQPLAPTWRLDETEDQVTMSTSSVSARVERNSLKVGFADSDGKKVSLLQKNRDDVVPVVVSTNRYGLIWDNYSYSEFNETRGSCCIWSEMGFRLHPIETEIQHAG